MPDRGQGLVATGIILCGIALTFWAVRPAQDQGTPIALIAGRVAMVTYDPPTCRSCVVELHLLKSAAPGEIACALGTAEAGRQCSQPIPLDLKWRLESDGKLVAAGRTAGNDPASGGWNLPSRFLTSQPLILPRGHRYSLIVVSETNDPELNRLQPEVGVYGSGLETESIVALKQMSFVTGLCLALCGAAWFAWLTIARSRKRRAKTTPSL
jgi:hypothetical protein